MTSIRTLFLLGGGALLASAPVAHRGPLRFTSISAGGGHSCGITAEGAAYCWGRNEHGQLGDSSTVDRPAPVRVAGGSAFRVVTAGDLHTCGIDTDSAAYCWGSNDNGQLGIASTSDHSYPTRIEGGFRVTTISAGGQHTCATMIHWERQDRVACWGSNSHRQLGTRESRDSWAPVPAFGTTRYSGVAAGSRHTCAVTKEGTVFCWGANTRGQLGNGSRTDSPVPFPIRFPRRAQFATVTTGSAHSCALTSEGEVYCWGENASGQVGKGKGNSSIMPARLADTLRFTALSAGGDASCAVRRDGGVSCWGSNAAGQFGTSDTTGSRTPVPAVPGLTLTAISLGRAHACGLQADGSAYCWGRLGNGVDVRTTGPILVSAQP
jgi:alpha-tubulin suppressor-like RCC1 family protein